MTPVFVDDRLFDAAELPDVLACGPDGGAGLWVARRIVLLAWLLAGGTWGEGTGKPQILQARAWWELHSFQLHRWEPATVATILIQLAAIGAVQTLEEAQGGFHVQLAKELTA